MAKDIARIIGATTARDGYMEGNGYQVTWTFGHLCELKEPDDYTPMWKHWSLSALPMIPQRFGIKLINDEGIKKQFATIEKLMQAADSIINCGDAGQEGELIQRWVMQKAQAKCPVKRLWISSMTDEAIKQGFQELKDQTEYQSLYLAGLSRAIGDWILGMNATRLYTLKYGQNRQVLSIGRVQTPTLALIVNRQKEIDNFVSEPYWVLATIYRDTQFTATSGKFTSKEEGEKAFSTIAGKPFTVTDVSKKKGNEAPPHLYDLTSPPVLKAKQHFRESPPVREHHAELADIPPKPVFVLLLTVHRATASSRIELKANYVAPEFAFSAVLRSVRERKEPARLRHTVRSAR